VNIHKIKKGLLKMGIFIVLSFFSPVVIYQAFKNKEHPFFWIVLIIGIILCISAIIYGFWAIKVLINGLIGQKKTKSS
tara:strand:+ start:1342 stop:1575 length:234 start_codon:yes stop_codon:yes gene_type:complete